MANNEQIAEALERVVEIFEKKPAMALDTTKTTSVLTDGLKCIVSQGGDVMTVDMSETLGGEGSGPSPGFLGRGALISCVAIGLKMTAARAGVAFDKILVDVEMDWDDRGVFGMGDAPAATKAIRLFIEVESPAAADAIQRVIDEGLKNDPWLQTFINAQTIDPVIRISSDQGN